MEDMLEMQRQAYDRVCRMRERSRKLCEKPLDDPPHTEDTRWLLLLLLLLVLYREK